MWHGVPGKLLPGGFLRPLARCNSVPREQQNRRLSTLPSPPCAPPKCSLKQTPTQGPHWFLLGGLTEPPKTNEEASTSRFPLFQFTLPVERHQRGKALKLNVNLGSHFLPPDSSLGFSYVGFTSSGPTGVSPTQGCQRPSLPPAELYINRPITSPL